MSETEDRAKVIVEEEHSFPRWQTTAAGMEFPETRWSLVINSARDTSRSPEALEILCRTYWYPLYAYVRLRGHAPHDAQDLTQAFFEHLFSGDGLAKADPGKGRLRSYLLGALKHYLAYQHRQNNTQKRGGGAIRISMDEEEAEIRLRGELQADPAGNPDQLFERRWAVVMLDRALRHLESEFRSRGREDQFEVLSGFLARKSGSVRHAEVAARLGMSESNVRVTLHRMRKRYRELVRSEILATVSSPDEVEEEIRHLFEVLG